MDIEADLVIAGRHGGATEGSQESKAELHVVGRFEGFVAVARQIEFMKERGAQVIVMLSESLASGLDRRRCSGGAEQETSHYNYSPTSLPT